MDLAKLYTSPDGRVSRQIWWLYYVVPVFVGSIVIISVDLLLGLGLLGLLWNLAIIFPSAIVNIKRWHDRGKSGWWILLVFLPVIGWIWTLVECGFLAGTDGSNDYGPPAD